MPTSLRVVLALLVLPASALVLVQNARAPIIATPAVSCRPAVSALVLSETNDDSNEPEESMYTTPSFEFDAVTITALLGAVIAFQFFVLGNL